jgi:hypothetical protein
MVRCKFVCGYKTENRISMHPVYSGSEENKKFFAATPGGNIEFYSINPDALAQFEQGKEYYIDFMEAK